MKKNLGSQLLAEFYDCDPTAINDKEVIRSAMLQAAVAANATIVADIFHEFNPHGISGVVVIAESHIAIHSWPEHACASVDIFTCSENLDTKAAVDCLQALFKSQRVEVRSVARGLVETTEAK